MRKGITPIIAIIVLLLITVALAGAAWTYLSTYMTGLTGESIEVRDYFCVRDDTATIIVANTGQLKMPVNDITIIDTATGSPLTSGTWTDSDGTADPSDIAINSYATWQNGTTTGFSCNPSCTLRVVGGTARAQIARIFC